jgi:hypothetical protein
MKRKFDLNCLFFFSILSLVGMVGCQLGSTSGDGSVATGSLRAGIPPKATLVLDTGSELNYKATDAGRLFLYDATADQTVGRYHLNSGQTFIVDAKAGRATIDGNEVVADQGLKTDHKFKVYFLME